MANRRMYSKSVCQTDNFVELSFASQALYYQFGLEADDDGFVSAPKRIIKMLGCKYDDLQSLISSGYVFPMGDIVVIRHWNINNHVQKDRYKPTIYQKEKSLLTVSNGVYNMDTECIHDVSSSDTQVRLGKDSISNIPPCIPPSGETLEPDPPKQTGKSNKAQDAEALFERLWKEYPVKKGKASVSRKQKLKLLEIGETALMKAIERYKAELQKESWRTPKDGSTFFNSGYVDYLDENYEPSKPRADPGSTGNRFINFKQRENDYDELQKRLVQNSYK